MEKESELVLTDSGTVVEECAIFGTPCITIRESTERTDLIELGVNSLSGLDIDQMLDSVNMALSHNLEPVTHYGKNISDKIIGNSNFYTNQKIGKALILDYVLRNASLFKKNSEKLHYLNNSILISPSNKVCSSFSEQSGLLKKISKKDYIFPPNLKFIVKV